MLPKPLHLWSLDTVAVDTDTYRKRPTLSQIKTDGAAADSGSLPGPHHDSASWTLGPRCLSAKEQPDPPHGVVR